MGTTLHTLNLYFDYITVQELFNVLSGLKKEDCQVRDLRIQYVKLKD